MRSAPFVANTNATAAAMQLLRADAQAASFLLVNQQASPGMTVQVQAGVIYIGATKVTYAGGNSGTITAPSTNPRIDLLTIDTSGTLAFTTGTEAISPVAPTYPANKMVLAEIYNVVGETMIFDNVNQTGGQGYITDARPILQTVYPTAAALGTPLLNHSYTNNSGRAQLHIVSVAAHAGDGAGNAGLVRLTANVASTTVAEVLVQTSSTSTRIDEEFCLTFLVPNGATYEVDSSGTGTFGVGSILAWSIITF